MPGVTPCSRWWVLLEGDLDAPDLAAPSAPAPERPQGQGNGKLNGAQLQSSSHGRRHVSAIPVLRNPTEAGREVPSASGAATTGCRMRAALQGGSGCASGQRKRAQAWTSHTRTYSGTPLANCRAPRSRSSLFAVSVPQSYAWATAVWSERGRRCPLSNTRVCAVSQLIMVRADCCAR